MKTMIETFKTLTAKEQSLAGGKGGTLARLHQAGYPVPDGFVILPAAFDGDALKGEGWTQVQAHLARMRKIDPDMAFAVRSSAMSEDAAQASFAGEFETVLGVQTDAAIREAIHTVRQSRHAERVRAYSEAQGIDTAHEIAVVVQQLVEAEISGVLFTADPVTGSRAQMMGNFVHGLGDQLVSGEDTGEEFTLKQRQGLGVRVDYEGPSPLAPFARQLYKLGKRLEEELGCPQDIEWCVANGTLYLLQSRPITTLREYDPITYDWNSSFVGDFLWARLEPFPEVVTPSTWSLWQQSFLASNMADIPAVGNIGGRIYLNIALPYTLMMKLGKKQADAVDLFDVIVSPIPDGADIPGLSLSWGNLLREMILPALKMTLRQRKLKKSYPETIAQMPERCKQLRQQIQETQSTRDLIALWHEQDLLLQFSDLMLLLDAMTEDYRGFYLSLKKTLTAIIGKTEANMLIATMSGGAQDLTTIGPVVGLTRVVEGDMSREAYMARYGHRHANENELSQPRPYEDPNWLDAAMANFKAHPIEVAQLLNKRKTEFDTTWSKFAEHYPQQVRALRKKVDGFIEATHKREVVRGEVTRWVGVIRAFFLRAGDFLGLGEDVFFLTCDELLEALSGDDTAMTYVPARQATYQTYKALPPYPGWIRGRFNPAQWASDPNRRGDFADASQPPADAGGRITSSIIQGHPGSAGRVEGLVRRIDSPEEGGQLQLGEILVAVTTNVGWTPLFPRAAAVVTDIGAPLAHAAIVARELGIPAVVGCGNATSRLQTGDRVLVDGGQGTIEILH